MKSLTKRNLLLVVLSVIVAICSLTFAATVKPAKAAEKPVLSFQVMEAAQLRVNHDNRGAGLRFRVQMDYATASYIKANDDVSLGFIVTPKALFDARAEETVEEGGTPSYGADDYIKSISNFVNKANGGIIVDESTIYVADEANTITKWESTDDIALNGQSYYANAAIVDILEKNRDLDFTVVAFILNADGSYDYAVPSNEFSKSVYGTANSAYLKNADARNSIDVAFDWYASNSYPVTLSSKGEYDAFAESTETESYTDKYVKIAAPIDLGAGDGSEVAIVSNNFAGTLTVAKNATLVYENTANVGEAPVLAEEGCVAASVLADTIEVYDADKLNIKPSNVSTLYYRTSDELNSYSRKELTYVSKEELKTISEENSISEYNAVGFYDLFVDKSSSKDAIAYSMSGGNGTDNYYQRIDIPYSKSAYEIFAANGKFNSVVYEFMIQSDNTAGYILNRNAGYTTLMAAAGYYSDSWVQAPSLRVPTNIWHPTVASVENVLGSIVDNKLTMIRSHANIEFTLYMSEIRFVNMDETYVEWKGDYDFIVNESNYTKFDDSATTITYPISFVANADIPKTFNENGVEVELKNTIGYTGNAAYITAASESKKIGYNLQFHLYLNYTADEYKLLAEKGLFNKVKYYFMVTHDAGSANSSYNANTATFIRKSQFGGSEVGNNDWKEAVMTVENFLTTCISSKKYYVLRTNPSPKVNGINFYCGNLVFVNE